MTITEKNNAKLTPLTPLVRMIAFKWKMKMNMRCERNIKAKLTPLVAFFSCFS